MTPTITDYKNTLAAFNKEIGQLNENGLSVFLYGSMARDNIVPGHSDLDFWVFLREQAMVDEACFYEALDVMVDAAKVLKNSGLPTIHAFCYYGEDEIGLLPAALIPNLQTDGSSQVTWGEDIRGRLSASIESRAAYRAAYFLEMRQHIFHPLTPLMHKSTLEEKERQWIVGALKYVKYLAEAACAALDLWPGERDAIPVLARELPTIDIGVIERIETFRTGANPTAASAPVRSMLILALEFVEEIHTAMQRKSIIQPSDNSTSL